MLHYFMYNICFSSDIPLFNIPQTSFQNPDVFIHEGNVTYEGIPEDQKFFYLDNNVAVLDFFCGKMRICHGEELVYSIKPGFSSESVTPFIVGWGLSFILTHRKHSVFHCSALSYNNKCFFVSGISGAGKSTTALELIHQGCKYLADDIAIVDSLEDMMVLPAFPIQKVCPDVSISLPQECLYSINNDRGKFSYLNTSDYLDKSQKLFAIIKLTLNDSDDIVVTEETGLSKFYRIMECLFLLEYYSHNSIPNEEKYRCLKIAEKIRVYTVSRPKQKDTREIIAKKIMALIDN